MQGRPNKVISSLQASFRQPKRRHVVVPKWRHVVVPKDNLQGRPNGIERHHFTNPTRGKLTLAALGARADEHINVLETLVQENTNHAERRHVVIPKGLYAGTPK